MKLGAYTPQLVQRVPLDFEWPLLQPYDGPPLLTGEGWQFWESFPERARPISPVFATAEGLALWCTHHLTMQHYYSPWWDPEMEFLLRGPFQSADWLELIHRPRSSDRPWVGITAFRDDWIVLYPFPFFD